MKDHPDEEVQRAAADPNAGGVELKDDLGQEIPGPAWFACMQFPGLDAGREIVRLMGELDDTAVALGATLRGRDRAMQTVDELRTELDAARKELEQQKAETLRAERWGETQFDARRKAEMEHSAATLAVASMRSQRDAARTEADELRAQRDRAEVLCQEHATLIKQLEERLRQATQAVGRSTMPTVPPRVGYRFERRDGTECEIVRDYGNGVAYRFAANDSRTYTTSGEYGAFRESHILDLVREIGPVEQGDAK